VDSKLSLMDEPLSNLDAKLRVSVRTFLKEIHRKTGATTIFVTHDQAEAMALADRIVVMNEGRIEQVGSTREIYNECESLFTAQFMGTPPANIQRVVLASSQGRLVAAAGGNEDATFLDLGDLHAFPGVTRLMNEEVFLAIRPENIAIVEPNGINETSVEIVEPQGAYTILVARVLGSEWKIMLEGDVDIRIDQKVSLKVDPADVMLYDVQTTKRIRLS
jgi:ABC-type sugar transport system ATPase subunit